ncbi:Methyl-accepting chemotaxis protein [uncultured Synechococcales cyanobacterium]|uniref:Methyl-accepting chemotaxis protein n=1 Tax=uncultured Synechococcales cyanobacterium TaxID=1936017 RepID=A0A6J4V9K7_9CYAN|nr:Methyl-accepting chemotaxis protein [uncultured Synechococcales cyanobacterium]
MAENRISTSLSPADREAVLAAVSTIREKLPFLMDLTVEERRSLPKMGDKSRAFVSKALEVATQNPDFLPRSFDIEEMRRDVELFQALHPILLSLTQLQELLDDTYLAVGSDAYTAGLVVYNYAKNSGQGAGLDAVVDEMGRRFARKSRGT